MVLRKSAKDHSHSLETYNH